MREINMIICICHSVSERELNSYLKQGLSLDEIQEKYKIGTTCKKCSSIIQAIVSEFEDNCYFWPPSSPSTDNDIV